VAFALFITSVVFAVATIANNNLQDLKTGQLVDATPWKQQVALVIGVVAGAAIIPPMLDLLNQAYGFVGAPGRSANALAAPQAGLISALAQGRDPRQLDWSLIGSARDRRGDDRHRRRCCAQDQVRASAAAGGGPGHLPADPEHADGRGRRGRGWYFDRRADRSSKNPEATKQLGVLLASGMIVGEGLLGVIIAAFVAFSGKDYPLALVGDAFANAARTVDRRRSVRRGDGAAVSLGGRLGQASKNA
jgi:hypothetical protein